MNNQPSVGAVLVQNRALAPCLSLQPNNSFASGLVFIGLTILMDYSFAYEFYQISLSEISAEHWEDVKSNTCSSLVLIELIEKRPEGRGYPF